MVITTGNSGVYMMAFSSSLEAMTCQLKQVFREEWCMGNAAEHSDITLWRTSEATGDTLWCAQTGKDPLSSNTGHSSKFNLGLPWWLRGKEFACQSRRHGFSPWSGKIPRAAKPMDHNYCTILCSRAQEPQVLRPCVQLLKPTQPQDHGPQQGEPLQWEAQASQLEKSPHSTEDPAQPIHKIIKNSFKKFNLTTMSRASESRKQFN